MVILALNAPSPTDEEQSSANGLVELISDLAEELAGSLSKVEALRAELALERKTCDELKIAVETNRRIGAAMGILMARHRITEQQSFELLRSASQATHRKLRDIAVDVIETGMLELQQTVEAPEPQPQPQPRPSLPAALTRRVNRRPS